MSNIQENKHTPSTLLGFSWCLVRVDLVACGFLLHVYHFSNLKSYTRVLVSIRSIKLWNIACWSCKMLTTQILNQLQMKQHCNCNFDKKCVEISKYILVFLLNGLLTKNCFSDWYKNMSHIQLVLGKKIHQSIQLSYNRQI